MAKRIRAYMLILTKIGKEREVLEELKKIEGVVEADILYGEYDIIAKIEDDTGSLDKANLKIRKLNDVIRTVTLVAH